MTGRPRYELFDSAELARLPPLARAQVVQSINVALIADLVELAAGGLVPGLVELAGGAEAILPAGFRDRIGTRYVETNFDDAGRYRVLARPITPELNHPGVGSLWERMTGPRRDDDELEVWGVSEYGDAQCLLRRVDQRTGAELAGKPLAQVRTDLLRRGVGWRAYRPPLEAIEAMAGVPR